MNRWWPFIGTILQLRAVDEKDLVKADAEETYAILTYRERTRRVS